MEIAAALLSASVGSAPGEDLRKGVDADSVSGVCTFRSKLGKGGDQLSIDRGQWVLAGEVSLEDPPPVLVFASHTLPTELEAPYSKLLDARWVDLFLHKLNEFDLLNEKKKKLAYRGGRHPIPPDDSAAASVPTPNPKKQPKPPRGGKGKDGKGKGDAGGAGSPDPAPQ